MRQDCWQIWTDRGCLINPDPVVRLRDALDGFPIPASALAHAETLAAELPDLLETRRVRRALEELPVVDLWALHSVLDEVDSRVVERLMQMYSYFASAFVYATHEEAAHRIPAGVAVPLVQLADMVERPPILSYSSYVLGNWERIDPNGAITVDNTRLVQQFLGNKDESWFIRIHVDIEARAADALINIQKATDAAGRDDAETLETALTAVIYSLRRMVATFHRMPEGCDSDVYYFNVRPYIFGFNNVVYEGTFGGQPQSFRGQTGAQSSIVPVMVAALGLQHETTGLTQHLEIMKNYMPKPHRDFIAQMGTSVIRDAVLRHRTNRSLAEIYNECLRQVLEFRRLHFHYATTYIAEKVQNPLGTGGTVFMDWLNQLIRETEQHMV
ncbi:MAG: indoleamine 2,3-dioxygenase [Anaerolineae bacterium]